MMRPLLERTHDISQTGYHIKDLRTFGESLTNAVYSAFPKGKSRYNEVHVLLLSWKDDRLGVMEEITELRSVFDQTYHYHVEEWKIPSTRSHNSLIRRLTDFLDDYERKENLLLVYYGGHGYLNDDRQLTWSCNELEDSPTVQWVGIQNMLEQAISDVLILLDCCAAATASADLGSGVTEVIAACGFETSAPGVCEHSFTRSLIEELRYSCKRSPLSAAILHMKVLSRMKYWKPTSVETTAGEPAFHERRKTPVHTLLTNEGKPRSIVLSPIESTSFLSPEVSAPLAHSASSDSSSQDVEMEDSSNDSATTSIPSSVSSPDNSYEQSCPTVLIAVALEEDQRLQLDTWAEWLRDIPAIARYARVEGIYESNSTLMLLSLPINVWDLIPNNPAVSFIGFIKSQNLLNNHPLESSTAQAANFAPTSVSPPAVIEALATNDGPTPEKSREWSACIECQELAETCTPQSPDRASAQQRCRYCKNHGLPCHRYDRKSGEYYTTVKHGRRSTSHLLISSSQIRLSEPQSQKSHVDTTRRNLAENPTSTSISGFDLKTNTFSDTTRGVHIMEATLSRLRQMYSAATAAYDTYIRAMTFLSDYQGLRTGLMIERYRIVLWSSRVLADAQCNMPTYNTGLWALFKSILTEMLETFLESHDAMEKYGTHNSVTRQKGLSGVLQSASLQPVQHSHEGSELLESMSIATKSPPEHTLMKIRKTLTYALLEKKRIERLLQNLCSLNNSLDGLTPTQERESSRRRLRAYFSTSNTTELHNLKAAAAFLKHQDIERMANARIVIEQEESDCLVDLLGRSQLRSPDRLPSTPLPVYRLEADEFGWREVPYSTDRSLTMATWRGESVIVDWQDCLENGWMPEYSAAFQRHTQKLITVLNTGLSPLNLAVLHCVGYVERTSTMSGYAFRLPPDVESGQSPVTLHHLLCNVKRPDDIPDLGARLQLAKALVLAVFEIHSLGWMHRNIQPKSILFWSKPNSKVKMDISKPYLIGFDISRPNQLEESLGKPLSQSRDDIYLHPLYKGATQHSFQPSFDLYSLGIVLYEIGLWRCIRVASRAAPGIPKPRPIPAHNLDPLYIDLLMKDEKVVELKKYMGRNYRDAVMVCLRREFDVIWEQQEGDRQKQLRTYLEQVQNKVVDVISACSA